MCLSVPRWVEADFWESYQVWLGFVLRGVWHHLHDAALLSVQRSCSVWGHHKSRALTHTHVTLCFKREKVQWLWNISFHELHEALFPVFRGKFSVALHQRLLCFSLRSHMELWGGGGGRSSGIQTAQLTIWSEHKLNMIARLCPKWNVVSCLCLIFESQ